MEIYNIMATEQVMLSIHVCGNVQVIVEKRLMSEQIAMQTRND